MQREEFLRNYWAYYLLLEEKFIHTLNYVELAKENFGTYSNEYAALIQMIGAELDSFFKVYCASELSNHMGKRPKKLNIIGYRECIKKIYPDIAKQIVEVRSANIKFYPYKTWQVCASKNNQKPLPWWKAFTSVKHDRANNKSVACQKNALYILGALYLLEMNYLKRNADENRSKDIPDEESNLFLLPDWDFRYANSNDLCLVSLENSTAIVADIQGIST